MSKNFHEHYHRSDTAMPSDRSTGLVFASVALIIAGLRWNDVPLVYAALTLAGVLAAVSLIAPMMLRPLNRGWMKFALLLGKISNPIIMGILFAVVIVPAGLIMQMRQDPLRKSRKGTEHTYWIERTKPATQPSMADQF
jgi:hypothetical protein